VKDVVAGTGGIAITLKNDLGSVCKVEFTACYTPDQFELEKWAAATHECSANIIYE
jgi:hypothetical protein